MLNKKQRIFLLINLLFITIVILLNYLNFFSDRIKNRSELINKVGENINIRAWVCQEREEREDNSKLVLCYKNERILVTTNLYQKYSYGDELEIKGKINLAEKFNSFDYPSYLLRYQIQSIIYYPNIKKIGEKSLNFWQKKYKSLLSFKQKIREMVNVSLPEPCASLANAMLLGYKKSLSIESKEIFSKTGLSHLVAISGAHLSIISSLILNFLMFLNFSKKRANYLVIVFLIIFPILSGLSASCVRAALMAFFLIVANLFNRLKKTLSPLILTASIMLIINPLLIFYDIGFQLSFLAVLGIIYLFPLLEKFKKIILKKCKIKIFKKTISVLLSYLNISIAVQIFCLPIIVKNFQIVSGLSFLANILVIWIFPLIFISLIIAIILSFIFPAFLLVFFYPSYVFLRYLYEVARYLASFDLVFYINEIKSFHIFIYYIVLYIIIKKLINKKIIKDVG